MVGEAQCGYVSIIGKPNVGKSTLLNAILGQKLSITSRKPQTTRHSILGIKTKGQIQTIYVDTPGIHSNSRNTMNRYMNQSAKSAIVGVDLILFLLGALRFQNEDQEILDFLKTQEAPVFLVVNKIDLIVDKARLLPFIDKIKQQINLAEILFISALKQDALDTLEQTISTYLPKAPHVFDEDELTDKSAKFIVSERIREKLTRRLGAELPYSLTVQIEAYEEESTIIKISAVILVERDNQKPIVIGTKGAILKSVGVDARQELEDILGKKILLKLWVKVRSGWADDVKLLNSLGHKSE